MEKPRNVNIAKWGAACSPCAVAKAKCIRTISMPGSKCDRCERLERNCVEQVHRPRKKRQSRPSKTAELEERLNSLVDFIKANNSGDVPASLKQIAEVRSTTSYSGDSEKGESPESNGNASKYTPIQPAQPKYKPSGSIPEYYNQHAPRACICRGPAGEEGPEPLEPDDTPIITYMENLLPNFPFVPLPQGTSATELISKRPFLFGTIRMVASYRNIKSMRSQNYYLLQHISEQMLMRSERSLELLQAILLILGYYHYHCMLHAQMNNLIGLANSLVADLGLNKPPDMQERIRIVMTNVEPPRPRTNEEKRALCGVWYMTSIISLAFQKIDPPRYTPYIDQCLKELEEEGEYETDSLLVHLVRIQHLSERIAQLHNKDGTENDMNGITRAPVSAYCNIFQTEVEKFRDSLPPNLSSNKLIMIHVNTAMLRLWEPPRIDATLLEKISNSLSSLSLESASSLDVFYRSIAALKAWFDYWLSIEISYYFVLPMPMSAHLLNAVTMLARWSKISNPLHNFQSRPPGAGATPNNQIVRNEPGCGGASLTTAPTLGPRDIDPAIPAAVHTIRRHLRSQPALHIHVPGILQAMVARFEQAREVSENEGGIVWENEPWLMAARKLKGTHMKLEKWAELVAAANKEGRGDAASVARESDTNGGGGGGGGGANQEMENGWPVAPPSGGGDMYAQVPLESWSPGVSWATDFFDGLGMDHNFFEGNGSYDMGFLNSM
ncbi:hypothetical protein M426DRAFT_322418 [Hypoxylon sp. CI-4A]|nr:hypothetical protein M426DRAFT_322418 [Hypoxylon sp. CI-4A]